MLHAALALLWSVELSSSQCSEFRGEQLLVCRQDEVDRYGDVDAYYNLALAYEDQNQLEKAATAWSDAERLDPHDVDISKARKQCAAKMGTHVAATGSKDSELGDEVKAILADGIYLDGSFGDTAERGFELFTRGRFLEATACWKALLTGTDGETGEPLVEDGEQERELKMLVAAGWAYARSAASNPMRDEMTGLILMSIYCRITQLPKKGGVGGTTLAKFSQKRKVMCNDMVHGLSCDAFGYRSMRPNFVKMWIPGLTEKPFWDAEAFAFVRQIEAALPDVTAEYEAYVNSGTDMELMKGVGENTGPQDKALVTEGWWGDMSLFSCGAIRKKRWGVNNAGARVGGGFHCDAMPKTCALVDAQVPESWSCPFAQVHVSQLKPGTEVATHQGQTNLQLSLLCPMQLPKGQGVDFGVAVGGEERTWKEGKCLMFDDSFNHSVWHRGPLDSGPRTMLMFRLWHPEVPVAARRMLVDVLGARGLDGYFNFVGAGESAAHARMAAYLGSPQADADFAATLKAAASQLESSVTMRHIGQ